MKLNVDVKNNTKSLTKGAQSSNKLIDHEFFSTKRKSDHDHSNLKVKSNPTVQIKQPVKSITCKQENLLSFHS